MLDPWAYRYFKEVIPHSNLSDSINKGLAKEVIGMKKPTDEPEFSQEWFEQIRDLMASRIKAIMERMDEKHGKISPT
jgi:hypothetical protein